MSSAFDAYYENRNYIQSKRRLFNYLLRKRSVARFLTQAESPILDIGSGIAPMVDKPAGAVLADMSSPGMKIMRAEGFDCCLLDIQQLGLKSGSVRTIVCSEVLEHVPDDRLAVTELTRVLAPGGLLVITVPLHRYYWASDDETVGHLRRYDPAALSKQLGQAGLHVESPRPIGSIVERALTLGAVVVFQRLNRNGAEWKRPPGRLFTATNRFLAQTLRLLGFLSPVSTSSIGLFICRKPVAGLV
jgi:SAM-dependent methyltransferase